MRYNEKEMKTRSRIQGDTPMMVNRQQLANQIQALNGDQVKALVLDWLMDTEGRIDDFSELLEEILEAVNHSEHQSNVVYGDLDESLTFQPLSAAEMVARSLTVLDEYKRTRQGIPQEQVQEWLDEELRKGIDQVDREETVPYDLKKIKDLASVRVREGLGYTRRNCSALPPSVS
jgi:CRISPR/Cas system CSM-associated protein Csm2 small subunit